MIETYQLLIAGGLYFTGIFLNKFFSKKAENTATKQDVEKITQKIESVKHSYSSEIESIKASLNHTVYTKNSIVDKTSSALQEYYDSLVDYMFDVIGFGFGDQITKDHHQLLADYEINSGKVYQGIRKKFQKLIPLLGSEEDLYKQVVKTLDNIRELEKSRKKNIIHAKLAYDNEVKAWNDGVMSKEIAEENNKRFTLFYDAIDNHRKKADNSIEEFISLLSEYYQKIST